MGIRHRVQSKLLRALHAHRGKKLLQDLQNLDNTIVLFLFLFNLTYSRWTSLLPSCLWSQRIFPSLPGSRLTNFYRDASSALLQLVNQWLNFTYSRSHAFRYKRKNTNPNLERIELTSSALAGVQVTYYTTCCCCFLTLTDPLRIQPWSQDRRNQTKSTGNRR